MTTIQARNLLILCAYPTYKVFAKKYDDLLEEHENVSVILEYPLLRVGYICMHYFHLESC